MNRIPVRFTLIPRTHHSLNSLTYHQVAKNALLTTVSTLGVIDALMLSFVVPSLSTAPASLAMEEDPEKATRIWFWLSFMSVIMSITSLILATIILTYCTPVPNDGMADYLVRHHMRGEGLYS